MRTLTLSAVLCATLGVAWLAFVPSGLGPAPAERPRQPGAASRAAASAALGDVRFVPNLGQWDEEVRYGVLGANAAWLHADGFTVRFARHDAPRAGGGAAGDPARPVTAGAVLRTRFPAAAAALDCEDRLPGVYNFLRGADPTAFCTHVPAFARVVMRAVLPGIDVVFRGAPAQRGVFEYDLLLAPGADLDGFVARCEGADSLRLDGAGRLCIGVTTPTGQVELVQDPPIAWQPTDTGLRPIEVAFRLVGDDGYGFVTGPLDPSWPAVVDPSVAWSTYLGGGASDSVNDLAWVPGTAIWVGGWAGSMDFPATPGAYQSTGARDGFVARLDESGTTLQFATYFGGSGGDEVRGIGLGPGQTPTLVGFTDSIDLPVTPQAWQPSYGGASPIVPIGDAFVARLSAAGDALLASTYLGGSFDDAAEAVAVDAQGYAHVAGWTSSPDFPTTPGSWRPFLGGAPTLQADGFLARIAPDGRTASWSTYVGGTFHDQFLDVELVPGSGDVVAVGWSASANFPTTSLAYRTTSAGLLDMVAVRLAASGAAPVWSTFLGGIAEEQALGVAIGADESVWITGWTTSSNYPVTSNAPQPSPGGEQDGVVSRLTANGQGLLYSTRLGGPDDDKGRGIALDGSDVMVVGEAGAGFPVTAGAAQPAFGGGTLDGFVAHFTNDGAALAYASYAGGAHIDTLDSVALATGLAALGGWSFAADFPTTPGALQTQLLGVEDGVVMMLDLLTDLGGGLGVSSGGDGQARYVAAGEHELLAIEVQNAAPRALAIETLRILVAGRGHAPAQVRDLTLWLDDPAVPGDRDRRVAGPVPVVADDAEVELALTGAYLPVGARGTLRVVADLSADATAGTVEVACAVVGADSWGLRAFGAGSGPTVRTLGSGRCSGPVLVAGALPGDADGDGVQTVLDLRRMCTRFGVGDPLVDADGDAVITPADVDLTREAVLARPTALQAPSVVQRGAWLVLRGVFPVAGSVDAALGGRSLRVGCLTPRELTLFVAAEQPTGSQELSIHIDAVPVVIGTVVVQ